MYRSWFRGGEDRKPPEKSSETIISEALIYELETQMQIIEDIQREKELKEKPATNVDYSWLATKKPRIRPYQLSNLQKLEIEELCLQVKPSESNRVITRFRQLLEREPSLEEIPDIFKATLKQVLQERPTKEASTSLAGWVMKHTSNLARLRQSTKVTPFSSDDTPEAGKANDDAKRMAASMPNINDSFDGSSPNEADQSRPFSAGENYYQSNSFPEFCKTLADLPV